MNSDLSEKTSKSEDGNRSSCLLILLLGVLFFVCFVGFCFHWLSGLSRKHLEESLPENAQIVEIEEEWGGGLNGDYSVVAKIAMSAESFDLFVVTLKVPQFKEDKYSNTLDVSGAGEPWWVSPREETIIYKEYGEHWILKVFYQDGAAYYIDQGW